MLLKDFNGLAMNYYLTLSSGCLVELKREILLKEAQADFFFENALTLTLRLKSHANLCIKSYDQTRIALSIDPCVSCVTVNMFTFNFIELPKEHRK